MLIFTVPMLVLLSLFLTRMSTTPLSLLYLAVYESPCCRSLVEFVVEVVFVVEFVASG